MAAGGRLVEGGGLRIGRLVRFSPFLGERLQQCQCGSRRVVLAAVVARGECERIVRHLAVANPEDFVAIRGPPAEFEFVDAGPDPWDLPDDDPGDELAA